MTEPQQTNAGRSRAKKLEELQLHFPIWVFDADQSAWPRKLADVLPGSRPAKITGWYTWPWEYGTDLRRIDDEVPRGVTVSALEDGHPGPIQHVLSQLLYDDRFEFDTFRVVYDAGDGTQKSLRDFSDWVFDTGVEGHIAPRRIVRIERKWDDVPVWDHKGRNILTASEKGPFTSYGIASLVHNDDELLRATGVDVLDAGDKIRKAQFEFLDAEAGQGRGIVYPGKNQKERGLYITRGPDFAWNKRLLSGTTLEGAPWSDVEDYVHQRRNGPFI